MRRPLLILLGLSLALASCARLKRTLSEPPATPTAVSGTTASVPAAASATPAAQPTPDFASMTFSEKNELFLELLAARQAEGVDTTAAQEAYARCFCKLLKSQSLRV